VIHHTAQNKLGQVFFVTFFFFSHTCQVFKGEENAFASQFKLVLKQSGRKGMRFELFVKPGV
jgi:hypothetical protein